MKKWLTMHILLIFVVLSWGQNDLDPNLIRAKILVEEGRVAIRSGKFVEGMNKWEKAIQLCPQFKIPYFERGNMYQKRREYLSAILQFKRILQIAPQDPIAYYKIGESYSELKEWDKAIQNFTPAIEYNPEYIEAYTKRAYAYQNRGFADDWQRAIKDFEKAAAVSKKRHKKASRKKIVAQTQQGQDSLVERLIKLEKTVKQQQQTIKQLMIENVKLKARILSLEKQQ